MENSGRVWWAIEALAWLLESHYLTVIPPWRGSPYHYYAIKNLLSLQWFCSYGFFNQLSTLMEGKMLVIEDGHSLVQLPATFALMRLN